MRKMMKQLMLGAALACMLIFNCAAAMAVSGTVDTRALVLRVEADKSSKALQTLSRGDKVTILHRDGSWYKVRYGSYTGYVLRSYVKADGDVPTKDEADSLRLGSRGSSVKALQTRLKALGYLTGSADGVFGAKTEAAVKAFQVRNGLTADGIAGSKTLDKLNSSSAKAAQDATDSSTPTASATLRPGASGSAVRTLQTRLKALGYYTRTVDGVYGSGTTAAVKAFQTRNSLTADGIAGSATLTRMNSSSAISAKDDAAADTTLRPGASGSAVKTMQTRLKALGYYTRSVDGVYGSGTTAAVKAFQTRNGLTADGIAGSATLAKMNSDTAVSAADEAPVTERLDWYNGGASVIPRGATFQIKDVRTGLVFTAKRQGGVDHLDAEPLTAADSAQLLRANGGSYSWRRRPILVMYNGHVYAASIYSEPHGSDTLPDNNYAGQFCIHFYGSKTHGTDRVDADHQSCVAEAMKATW